MEVSKYARLLTVAVAGLLAGLLSGCDPPKAGFSVTPQTGEAPLTVRFTDESIQGSQPIASWQWDFGDGTTAISRSPSKIYESPGIYTVSLTVTNSLGTDTYTLPDIVKVEVLPKAAFSGEPTRGNTPLTVVFADESAPGTLPILSWLWDFGDGKSSTLQNPSHVYTQSGMFTVSLTVTSAAGSNTVRKGNFVRVQGLPSANFTSDVTEGAAPLTVQFTDNSSAGSSPITSYEWDFGDGQTSTQRDPVHTYTRFGRFTVSLRITTGLGTDTELKEGYIFARELPTPDFTNDIAAGPAPLTVKFTDASVSQTSPIVSYRWNFGDNSLLSTQRNPTHTYAVPGVYSVSLTVSSANGMRTLTKPALISVSPQAAFDSDLQTGVGSLLVLFRDLTVTGSAEVTNRTWTFGDGTEPSNARNPVHEYVEPGQYTVSLSLTTSRGDTTVKTEPNYIKIAPIVGFAADQTRGTGPLTVTFSNQSVLGRFTDATFLWDFGDGGTSEEPNPVHTYAANGTYGVSLAVTTPLGVFTDQRPGLIEVTPVPGFTADVTSGRAPLTVRFTDTTDTGGLPITRRWEFGDGTPPSAEANPVHVYQTPGIFDVTLMTTTPQGSDTESRAGFVRVTPVPVFTVEPASGTAPLQVRLADASDYGGLAPGTRTWDFGDMTAPGLGRAVSHTYGTAGIYNVGLTIATAAGTESEARAGAVTVFPAPSFSAAPTSGPPGTEVTFENTTNAGGIAITGVRWNFGDGSPESTEAAPKHVYAQPGNYDVTLTLTAAGGNLSRTQTALVKIAPVLDFTMDIDQGPAPLTVRFTDQSNLGRLTPLQRRWDFGDLTAFSPNRNPLKVYETPGTFDVTMIITTEQGEARITKPALIRAKPVVRFEADVLEGPGPLAVQFDDQTVLGFLRGAAPGGEGPPPFGGAGPVVWTWDFGDGTAPVLEEDPLHTFALPGTYTVQLTITTTQGDVLERKQAYIRANPVVQFSADVEEGPVPLTVQFSDDTIIGFLEAVPPVGDPPPPPPPDRGQGEVIRTWNFGDGAPPVIGKTPAHTYAVAGTYDVTLTLTTTQGDFVEAKSGFIRVQPVVQFSSDVTAGPSPLTVSFTDETDPGILPILSWAWDFGDGGTSTEQHPAHTYTVPGTYAVTLSITTAQGTRTEVKPAHIKANPVAGFTADFVEGPRPHVVNFTDTTDTGILESEQPIVRAWNFGDGESGAGTNPQHTYQNPGVYTVTLTLTTSQGDFSEAKTDFITVNEVDFTVDVTGGTVPLTVQFTNTTNEGVIPVLSRLWDFGDGGTSTEANPQHTYAEAGTFDVTLTITTANGTVSEVKPQLIKVDPVLSFTSDATRGFVPFTAAFTDTTPLGQLTVVKRTWNFGDGTPLVEGDAPMHAYTVPGNYDVTLTLETTQGNYVLTQPGYSFADPVAAFSASATSGFTPFTTTFTDETVLGNVTVTSRTWDFGDTGQAAGPISPAHTYVAAGTYDVKLTLETSQGAFELLKPGFIESIAVVTFTADITEGPAPQTIQFTDTTDPGALVISNRVWDFGDMTPVSNEQDPMHTYTLPGTYTVGLTITTQQGMFSETRAGFIRIRVVPDFTTDVTSGAPPLAVTFADTTAPGNLNISNRTWVFGDGSFPSTNAMPTRTYTVPGTYSPMLTVTTEQGNDSATKPGLIEVNPVPDFSANATSGVVALPVQFTDTSNVGNLTATAWAWDFGDGGTSTEQNPLYTYTTPGTYNVALTITTSQGDFTVTKPQFINARLGVQFSGDVLSGNVPLAVQFTDDTPAGNLTITAWQWDFGDGTTSTQQNPLKTYTKAGTYNVRLTVTTAQGTENLLKENYIAVNPVPNFTASVQRGPGNLNVSFTNATDLGNLQVLGFDWAFGDGGTSIAENPTRLYTAAGSYAVSFTIRTSQGDFTETKPGFITVNPIVFSVDVSDGGVPLAVKFTDETDPGDLVITARQWDFGDGSPASASPSPTRIYATPGVFSPTLTITTANGQASLTRTDLIQANIDPEFTANVTSGPRSLNVQFTDTTVTGGLGVVSRLWDFGDGGTSTAQNPAHTYTTAGNFDVTLSITTSLGTESTEKLGFISVNEIEFSSNLTVGAGSMQVQFTDETVAGGSAILTRTWDFGDGTPTGSGASPSHVYAAPGTYNVTLTQTHANGGGSRTRNGFIVVNPITFTATPTTGQGSVSVQFTDTTDTGGQTVTSRLWDFGDATTSASPNPLKNYTIPNLYTVSLTVNTASGGGTTTSVNLIQLNVNPLFITNVNNGPRDLSVNFTDTTAGSPLAILSRTWSFGDGGTSNAVNPRKVYTLPPGQTTPGVFNATLSVTTVIGTATSTASAITVNPILFDASATSGTGSLATTFTDNTSLGSGVLIDRQWNFGDGNTTTTTNLSAGNTYTQPGQYTVSLRVRTNVSDGTETKTNFIGVQLVPSFTETSPVVFLNQNIQFTNTTNEGFFAPTYLWQFGDATTSTAENPLKSYATAGTRSVTFNVTTPLGTAAVTKSNLVEVINATRGLSTQFNSNNGANGNMFDIFSVGCSDVEGWAVNISGAGSHTIQVWRRIGTVVTCFDSPVCADLNNWILVGSASNVVSRGTDQPTLVNIPGLSMAPGVTYGIYIFVSSASATMSYTNGGPAVFSNADMQLTTWFGKNTPAFTGATNNPRIWNGVVFYTPTCKADGSPAPKRDDAVEVKYFDDMVVQQLGAGAAHAVAAPAEGGHVFAGTTDPDATGDFNLSIARQDDNGAVLWERSFGGAGFDAGYSIALTADGGFVAAGRTESFSASSDIYVVRTDANGDPVWEQTFGSAGFDAAWAVTATRDGGFLVAGLTDLFATELDAIHLLRLNALGHVIWEQYYDGRGVEEDWRLWETDEGGFILMGDHQYGDPDESAWVLRVNAAGVEL